ncbi:MAG: zinc ribbon domain-containing protein [Acholeplasmatales bacterium]|nr:zinc ribbon domain-containing protein [Acholeplasmatales bacterium]
MFCPNCGAELNSNQKECPYCGTANPNFVKTEVKNDPYGFNNNTNNTYNTNNNNGFNNTNNNGFNNNMSNETGAPVLGIISIVLFFFFGPLSLITSIIGVFSKNKIDKIICLIILILDILAVLIIVAFVVIIVIAGDSVNTTYNSLNYVFSMLK